MNFGLHQLRKRILVHATRLSTVAFVIVLVIGGGLISSWYAVQAGLSATTRTYGPWVIWTSAARADADPYTRAHFARSGALLLSTEIAHTYEARTDSEGLKLHSSCEYLVQSSELEARWWSIAVFDETGRLIPNPTLRHAFTSETVASTADGRFAIALSRDARPGNWLPTGGAGRLALVLTLLDPGRTKSDSGPRQVPTLPDIRKVRCQ